MTMQESDLSQLNQKLFDAIEAAKDEHHKRWRDLVVETMQEAENDMRRHEDCKLIKELPGALLADLEKRLKLKGVLLFDPISCPKRGLEPVEVQDQNQAQDEQKNKDQAQVQIKRSAPDSSAGLKEIIKRLEAG